MELMELMELMEQTPLSYEVQMWAETPANLISQFHMIFGFDENELILSL